MIGQKGTLVKRDNRGNAFSDVVDSMCLVFFDYAFYHEEDLRTDMYKRS